MSEGLVVEQIGDFELRQRAANFLDEKAMDCGSATTGLYVGWGGSNFASRATHRYFPGKPTRLALGFAG